jgi:hypothetical protein
MKNVSGRFSNIKEAMDSENWAILHTIAAVISTSESRQMLIMAQISS